MRRWVVAGTWADPEVRTGGPDPSHRNHKAYCFLILEILVQTTTILGHHRPISETPFQWRFGDGLMMARF